MCLISCDSMHKLNAGDEESDDESETSEDAPTEISDDPPMTTEEIEEMDEMSWIEHGREESGYEQPSIDDHSRKFLLQRC